MAKIEHDVTQRVPKGVELLMGEDELTARIEQLLRDGAGRHGVPSVELRRLRVERARRQLPADYSRAVQLIDRNIAADQEFDRARRTI